MQQKKKQLRFVLNLYLMVARYRELLRCCVFTLLRNHVVIYFLLDLNVSNNYQNFQSHSKTI